MGDPAELYPCGVRVRIPSLGVKLKSKSIDDNLKKRITTTSRNRSSRRIEVGNRGDSLIKNSSINEVVKLKLDFSDDIVETLCPETITYDKAREKMKKFLTIGAAEKMSRREEVAHKLQYTCSMTSRSTAAHDKRSFKRTHQKCLTTSDIPDNPLYFPVLQPIFPKPVSKWIQDHKTNIIPTTNTAPQILKRLSKGSRRWMSLPVRAQTPTELQLSIQHVEMPEEKKEESGTADHEKYGNTKLEWLLQVFCELMSTWKIFIQPDDLELPTAVKCMSSLSGTKQLYGLDITCQLFIRPRKRIDAAVSLPAISEEVLRLVESLLDAETKRVRVAAAILLCCCRLEENKSQITETLLSILSSPSSEMWPAVQTLAIINVCNKDVVTILFNHLCNSITKAKKEKASRLLAKLSADSKLVVSMLAEKLNSSCWNERCASCSLFPRLHHSLNKDVCDRLLHTALNDWNHEVRLAAAQALGGTGNGKLVHDAIKTDLLDSNERTRLSALKRIHILRLMTATLLPVFLQCFKDEYNSIKLEAITIAEDLQLVDDDVISVLALLLQDDCWRVRAHTIKAVGSLKVTSSGVISHLLWAARFEQLPEVRAQVCHTLAVLGAKDERIAAALKDILNVEDDEVVLREARKSLEILGHDAVAVDDMLDIVCAEVKSLGTKEAITQQIKTLDRTNYVNYVITTKQTQLSQNKHHL